jgi:polyisoprenoid-binding protein YceI
MKTHLLVIAVALLGPNVFAADNRCVISGRGHFQIHVGTAGLFSVFGHDHLIEAEKITGCANLDPQSLPKSSVRLEFETPAIRVLDPKESARDRAEVQKNMETDVLHTSEFPKVTFASTTIEAGNSADRFRVRGNLTIRGKTQPAVIPVTLTHETDGTYRVIGEYKFKQTSFGIKPIQVGGGAVKVKDEVQIDFELFLQ